MFLPQFQITEPYCQLPTHDTPIAQTHEYMNAGYLVFLPNTSTFFFSRVSTMSQWQRSESCVAPACLVFSQVTLIFESSLLLLKKLDLFMGKKMQKMCYLCYLSTAAENVKSAYRCDFWERGRRAKTIVINQNIRNFGRTHTEKCILAYWPESCKCTVHVCKGNFPAPWHDVHLLTSKNKAQHFVSFTAAEHVFSDWF